MTALQTLVRIPSDDFLRAVLANQAVDSSVTSPVRLVQATLAPLLLKWGNGYVRAIHPSGSFAKGTANKRGTDIDLFISVVETVPNTLAEMNNTLFNALTSAGYQPRRQNVSIGIRVGVLDVDLVPAKLQPGGGEDHSLYRHKTGHWTKTNVAQHITMVRASRCTDEMRIMKLWRDRHVLDFPSFYLELATWKALEGQQPGALAFNIYHALKFMSGEFLTSRIVDPANTNNVISDEMTLTEKLKIAAVAEASLTKAWKDIL